MREQKSYFVTKSINKIAKSKEATLCSRCTEAWKQFEVASEALEVYLSPDKENACQVRHEILKSYVT